MSNVTEIRIPYRPRPAFLPFHERTEREAVLVCHRRAGKTVSIANDAQKRCLQLERKFPPPRIAWFYPTRVRAKDIAWPYLKYYSAPIPGIRVIESELAIEYPNKGRVTLYGADNSRGVGLWLDGVYYDECDEINQPVISEVAPTLADYGGFSVYAGMLKGRYNLWKRYEQALGKADYFKLILRASESGIISQPELDRLLVTMGEAAYQMQLECNANASIANAIYGMQMDKLRSQNRLKHLAMDPGSPLYAFWDIGHSDRADDWTIWLVQMQGRDIMLLDYYDHTGEIPAHYAERMRQWEETYRQKIDCHYLPHDGSRHDQSGKSTEDYLRDAGLTRITTVPRTPNLWDSINQLRALFPRIWINSDRCCEGWKLGEMDMPSGVDCLDYYTKKQDVSTGLITDVPVHNQYSHGADALRTFSEAYSRGMLIGTSEIATIYGTTHINVSREPPAYNNVRRVKVNR